MSALRYHHSALLLAKATPSYSDKVAQQIVSVTGDLEIALPQAIVEWLCLDPEGYLFQHITQAPHYLVKPVDVLNHIVRHHFGGRETTAIELIFENQGCFVMAASLEEGNDPSVWVSSDFHFCDDRQPTMKTPPEGIFFSENSEVRRVVYSTECCRISRITLTPVEQREFGQFRTQWCHQIPTFRPLAPSEPFYDLGIGCGGAIVKQAKVPIDMIPPIIAHILRRLS